MKIFRLEARGANFLLLGNEGFEDEAEFCDFAAVLKREGSPGKPLLWPWCRLTALIGRWENAFTVRLWVRSQESAFSTIRLVITIDHQSEVSQE